MTAVSDRLKRAREQAGYSTATAFAETNNIVTATYRSHENGARGVGVDDIERYAQLLAVSPAWIAFGTGEMSQDDIASRLSRLESSVSRIERLLSRGLRIVASADTVTE